MEHLALEVFDREGTGSQFAFLGANTSITIIDTSEIFDSGELWTYPFSLNTIANAHIFGSSGELRGNRLHEQLDRRRARLWVEGIPMYYGYIRLSDEVDVDADGNVDITFESGLKTFDDIIEGMSARDVSVDDVVIGVALNRKRRATFSDIDPKFTLDGLSAFASSNPRLQEAAEIVWESQHTPPETTPRLQMWPKLVMSHGEIDGQQIDYTNVQTPYADGYPFCNINICYPYQSYDKDGNEVKGRGYTVRSGHGENTLNGGDGETRFNNAPNFYLLYWLDRMFHDLGITITENQAKDVEDLKRVFMLNYGCHYEEIDNDPDGPTGTPSDKMARYSEYRFPLVTATHGTGTYFFSVVSTPGAAYHISNGGDSMGKILARNIVVKCDGEKIFERGSIEGNIAKWGDDIKEQSTDSQIGYGYLAYATSDNYPNVDTRTVIDAMEAAFGIRLVFSADYKKVRIVLLRNIFRDETVQTVVCDIIGNPEKEENAIRGFRLTYGAGKEDTQFYYKGFNDMLVHKQEMWPEMSDKHDYSRWDLNSSYEEAKQQVGAFNRTCYVVPETGNAYLTKIDEEEKVLFPALFEVAGFMDAEEGDCTGEEETIHEVTIGAKPVIMNDVNGTYAVLFGGEMKPPCTKERAHEIFTHGYLYTHSYDGLKQGSSEQHYYRVNATIDFYINEGYAIHLMDNYDLGGEGISPFDKEDPGLCFGIMRSSGSEAYTMYAEDIIEDEGNDYWENIPGKGAIDHPDTCDNEGKLWDYTADGQADEQDPEGRFSLKLRAEKPNPQFDATQPESAENPRYLTITNTKLQRRGLMDQFYKEYSYWMRHARIARFKTRMELAQLTTIDKTKRVIIGGITGFIKKRQYSISNENGLGPVEVEMYYI